MDKGLICVSICATSAADLVAKVRDAEPVADAIEIRFDYLGSDQIDAALEVRSSKPLIATFRSSEQGGHSDADLTARNEFWSRTGNRFWAVDLEEDIFPTVETSASRIFSFHDHQVVPANLDEIADRMQTTGAEIIKIAVRANDAVDAIPVWKLLEAGTNIIPIAMGEAGKWTRILGLAHGAFMTYASLDEGSGTADGQITANDLIEIYRVRELDKETQVYGVIGDPVSGSLSPYLHNPAFRAAGSNSVFLHLQVKDLEAFIRRMVALETREVELNFAGFSVTMPHKQAIMAHLDEVDPVAKAIGAVNTVKVLDGRLIGHNTDAHGFITPLKKYFGDLHGVKVAMIGAGGAARACVYALKQEGADVTVYARDGEKSRLFADEFGVASSTISDLRSQISQSGSSGAEIIVNATPLGMKGKLENESHFSADELSGIKFVYDLVTKVTDTPLIREAKLAGIPAIGGMEMLIAQAEMQFEIWTGSRPEAGLMKNALLEKLRN